ncbi:MAG: TonB-dependent receptor [Bacteroidota bacterium]
MKQKLTFLRTFFILSILFLSLSANAQTVTGIIKDGKTNEALFGATVVIKGTTQGGLTDMDGKFNFTATTSPPFVLSVSYLGYVTFESTVNSIESPISIKIKPNETLLKTVEVVGDRITEKQKESPLTIEALDVLAIKETPAANFYEGLGQLKGVDIMAASIGFRVINTRGFNSTSPVRSLQIIDGVDNQSPGLNFSLGNFLGSSELDVQKVEIIVGAASAYYGPNAFNGVVSMTTKNPFIKPGVAFSFKVGERNLMETAVRYAEVFKNKEGIDKFAFKVNLSYMRANDWEADNMDATEQSDDGTKNPGGYDAVNRYGDENLTSGQNNATSKGQQIQYRGLKRWYRTGYEEKDLVDYNTKNLKVGAALHYRIKPEVELIYAFNFGTGTTVYQGDNRYSLKDIYFFQNRVELVKKDKFFIRAYATNEDAGKSYDAVFTALLLQDRSKDNATWGTDYRNFWNGAVPNTTPHWESGGMNYNVRALPGFPTQGGPPNYYYDYAQADAVMNLYSDSLTLWHSYARGYADNNRLEPGTQAFKDAFNDITSKSTYREGGSRLTDRSALYHIHGEYKFTPKPMDITIGANSRLYKPNSEGTVFSDTGSVKITNYEFGAYAGLEKKVMDEKLKLNLTTRVDKNQNFNFVVSPAASVVYNFNKNNILRLSFSSAIRNPTLADQYLYYNVGRAILIGNVNGFDSLVTVESIGDYYSVASPQRSSLVYFDIPPVRPEKVKSFEVGYRTTLFNNLFFDGSYYYSYYKDFLGYKLGGDVNFAPGDPNTISAITFYRVAANSNEVVITQGASVGLTYYFQKFFAFTGNYSWNELKKKSAEDPIIPAFNTPKNKFNIGFSGREINTYFGLFSRIFKKTSPIPINNIGFSINYKWVEGFMYEGSPQFTGKVPTYDQLDAQISKFVPKIHTTFKLGASNMLNNKMFQVYGGPRIGRMVYFSVLLELDRNK